MMPTIASHRAVIGCRSYNYRIDHPGRRLWLEDDDTKRQWQWRGDKAASSASKSVQKKDAKEIKMSDATALASLQNLFDKCGSYCVTLVEGRSGLRLTMRVPVDKTDWTVTHAFKLEEISMDDAQFARAQQHEIRVAVDVIKRQLTDEGNARAAAADAHYKSLVDLVIFSAVMLGLFITFVVPIATVVVMA